MRLIKSSAILIGFSLAIAGVTGAQAQSLIIRAPVSGAGAVAPASQSLPTCTADNIDDGPCAIDGSDEAARQALIDSLSTGLSACTKGLPEDCSITVAGLADDIARTDHLDALKPAPPASCAAIRQADPTSSSGRYRVDPDGPGGQDPFETWCLMDTDGGHWTLVGTISQSTPASALQYLTDYSRSVNDFSVVADPVANGPSHHGLFQGDFSQTPFTAAREDSACGTASPCYSVMADGLAKTQLADIRAAWAWNNRGAGLSVPDCILLPSRQAKPSCYGSGARSDTETSIVGWQHDVHFNQHCWAGRGFGAAFAALRGSGRCAIGADPDGTRWSLLWMR